MTAERRSARERAAVQLDSYGGRIYRHVPGEHVRHVDATPEPDWKEAAQNYARRDERTSESN